MSEIVIIGYQAVSKNTSTGSVSRVSGEALSKTGVATFEQALQGRIPGVIATQQSGQPGSGVLIEIRGAGGFGKNQGPLYIVDGVVGANGSTVNPADIESIDVLKDASTAAIYGARGANGVVIITTKRGKAGPVVVNYETSYGIQNITERMDVLNTREYIDFINRSKMAEGGSAVPQFDSSEKIDNLARINTDWQDEIFLKNSPVQNHNINISGGSENATFSLSGNYFDQQGALIETYYKRYSLRINSDFKAGKYLSFGESISLVRTKQRSNDNGGDWTNVINSALKMPPYLPPYDTDPTLVTHIPQNSGGWPSGVQSWEGNDLGNPLSSKLVEYDPNYNEIQASIYGQVNFTDELFYKINVGYTYNNSFNSSYTPQYYSGPYQSNSHPSLHKHGHDNQSVLIENTLNYNTTLAGKHNVSAILGVSKQTFNNESFGFGTNELPNEAVRNISTGANSGSRYIYGDISEYRLSSVFGRVNYDFERKYLFSATFRKDGTSRFGPERKFGNFPAFSAGWRVSQENFMKGVGFISDLKLFGSWGKLGGDNIDDFQYLPIIYIGGNNYNLGGTGENNEALYFGSRLNGFANPALQWQANVTTNLGLNIGLLENKLMLSAEYYVKKTDKLLQYVRIPLTSGYSGLFLNSGAVENKGIDLQLIYQDKIGNLNFDITGNFSTLKNRVTSLGSSPSPIFDGSILPNQILITKTDIGRPIGSFYGFEYVGIYQDSAAINNSPHIVGTRPGDIQYRDINGGGGATDSLGIPDGRITDKDKTYIGNPWPKFVYGLGINANFKGIDFHLFLQGVYGNDVFNVQNSFFGDGYQGRYNAYTKVLDSWTPENPSTSQHRLGGTNVNFVPSSRMVEDGSYMRIKNVQIGYSFPENISTKVGLNKLRIYISAQNLLTFTNYSGYDPEIGARNNSNTHKGIDVGNYPQAQTFLAGIQIGF